MHLYWKNTTKDGLWSTIANWHEDAAATVLHGSIPSSGDSVSYATGETATLTIDTTVDLGVGTCDIPGLVINNDATVSGGTFNGPGLTLAYGTIAGGTFTSDVTTNDIITGGTFQGTVTLVNSVTQGAAIAYGVFLGAVVISTDNLGKACVNGGLFIGPVTNDGVINGGIFAPSSFSGTGTLGYSYGIFWLSLGTLSIGGRIVKGAGPSPSPGFTEIHGYGDIFGTALL